ncbi:ORF6N domain-containing protein [Pectobacterium brasiliense]|uniref:ORF6N domain-containing protein n=1 Tax=Pectobacterium brasiliense TaxID=180957 RepID=UPI0015DDB579|nr:ORF6N domain-containing protein [Pectobacterium brasiliense]MBA0216753.1 ORF6N domain-containing protein [Pectobacterium brasiliense]MBN3073335.1 ORF6N domain-containing protein [Pectobacterium brasiliense]MBN3169133.1 ORF6N domain-containing protein [Pectobacterium brasiliense]
MTTQLSVESLSVVTHNNIPVVTSELLAQLYGTETVRIRQNHKRNSDRFIEGKHFFNLKDADLQDFKDRVSKRYSVDNNRPDLNGLVGKRARSLILWTERGAARHAKMLETDQAWDVFEKLEDCYFNPQVKDVQPLPQKPVHPCDLEFYIPETPLIFNHIQTSQLNALFKSVEYLTMDFWPHMQALFPTLDCKHGSAVNTVNLLMRLLKDKRAEADELAKLQ